MSAGARKPNASALVGIAVAASGIAAVSTTAILLNFRFMTLPSVYLAVNPHLNCSLRTWTSNKAQAGICNQLSRDISRHGESEGRREFVVASIGSRPDRVSTRKPTRRVVAYGSFAIGTSQRSVQQCPQHPDRDWLQWRIRIT